MVREQIEIAHVTPDDVPDVVELVRTVLAEFGLVFGIGAATDDHLIQLPASYTGGGGAFWVARLGGKSGELIGTCGVYPVEPATYELRKMYLRPTARGLGLGKRLLDAAVEWTRGQGGERIVLDTAEQMTRAITFYESHGFVRDDTQKRGERCTRGYLRVL
jgi:GNAT superfamily N-acetyltransferase